MVCIPTINRIKGQLAEDAFGDWLAHSKLGFMVVDQTPISMPHYMKRTLKRPDYLVGILSIGLVAVDVKARTPIDNRVVIDPAEHEAFAAFERYFGTPLWYVCYLDASHGSCLLFRNADIDPDRHRFSIKGRIVYAIPIDIMTPVQVDRGPFDQALLHASRACMV